MDKSLSSAQVLTKQTTGMLYHWIVIHPVDSAIPVPFEQLGPGVHEHTSLADAPPASLIASVSGPM